MSRAKKSTNTKNRPKQKTATKTRRRFSESCGSCHNSIDTHKHAYIIIPGRDYEHPIWFHWDCAPRALKQDLYEEE